MESNLNHDAAGKPKYKKKYKLKCFYPSTKQYADQTFRKSVDADRYFINKGGVYVFCAQDGTDIACYPTPYTIIEEIITNE